MATVTQMIERILSINWEQQIAKAMEETEAEMIAANQNQLLHGLDGDGRKMPKYRSNKYARVKNEMNSLPGFGVMDFKLTGHMFDNMYIDFEGNKVKIKSSVSYFGDLTAIDDAAFSLNFESKVQYYRDHLKPQLVKNIAAILGVPTI